jgi:hypothetical protein
MYTLLLRFDHLHALRCARPESSELWSVPARHVTSVFVGCSSVVRLTVGVCCRCFCARCAWVSWGVAVAGEHVCFLCGVKGEHVRECFRGVFQCCATASGRLLLIYWVGCTWALWVFLVFMSVNVLHFSKKKIEGKKREFKCFPTGDSTTNIAYIW